MSLFNGHSAVDARAMMAERESRLYELPGLKCEDCVMRPYSSGPQREGERVVGYAAGFITPCSAHDRIVKTRTWIADIPIYRFKNWFKENVTAFEIDAMKRLLPTNHAEYRTR